MKHVRLLLIFFIGLSFLISACTINKADNSESIPLLLHTSTDGGTETYLGAWDLSQYSVTMKEKLYQTTSRAAAHPILWDGKTSFVIEELPVSVEDKSLRFDNNLVNDGFMIYFCSPSLTITLNSPDGNITTKTLLYKNGNGDVLKSEIPNINPPQEYGIVDIVSEHEIFYATYEDGMIYAFFFSISPETAKITIYCLTYDPNDTNNAEWTKFESAESGISNLWYQNVVFTNKKLFIPSTSDLMVIDVSSKKINKLSSITEKVKNIISNLTLEAPAGPTAILPQGVWSDVVIVCFPLYTTDNSNHNVYLAYKDNEVLGAIDVTNKTINVYDNSLKLKKAYSSDSGFAVSSISLPKEK